MTRSARILVALVVYFLLPQATVAHAQERAAETLADRWEGVLHLPQGELVASIELRHGTAGWSGTFSLPAEGVVDLPVASVEVEGSAVVVVLAPGRIFDGRMEGDSLGGTMEVMGQQLPATFGRVGTALARRLAEASARTIAAMRAAPLEESREAPDAGGAARERVDEAALDRLVESAEESGTHALVVLHDGDRVGAWYAGGEVRRIEAMSATKSVVALATGRLLTTGALESLDVPVHHFYPEWSEDVRARVTVRHLLNHTSGLQADRTTEAIYASGDFVRHALESEVTSEPGTTVFYNNSATNLLAGVVGRAAGERMDLFLRNDLFARLGITDFSWSLDAAGNPHGMSGLQILPEDLAKLGQLALDRGNWEGEQLIDAEWFDRSLRPGSDLSGDWSLLWRLVRENGEITGFMAEGYLGQYLLVDPERRLVAVRMVEQTPAYDPDTDVFRDFARRVADLVAR